MVTTLSLKRSRKRALKKAVEELEGGRLVVFPTDTVYGLGAAAFNPFATAMIFQVKGRPRSLPLPVLVSSADQAWALASRVPPAAVALAEAFWPGALTIVVPESDALHWDLGETKGAVGVRVPAHPDALELLRMVGPVAATSANPSGKPTPRSVREIAEELGWAVGLYLDAGPAKGEIPSTVVDVIGRRPRIIREGAVPAEKIKEVLAKKPLL